MEAQNTIPCHCLRLRRAGNKLTEIYNAHLAECGLTSSQFSLLLQIRQNEPINTSKLAEIMSLDRTTLVRSLKSLEKEEYITFSRGKGRERPISLTKSGKEKQAQAMILWEKAQDQFEKALGNSKMEQFREILDTINKM